MRMVTKTYCDYCNREITENLNVSVSFEGEEKEWLVSYCKEVLLHASYDFFIFGHRHLPLHIKLNNQSTYVNLGDWISFDSYAVFNGDTLELKYHNKQ